jgi:hypothetical protein
LLYVDKVAPVALIALPLVDDFEKVDQFGLAQGRSDAGNKQAEDQPKNGEKAGRRHECGSSGWLASFTTESTENTEVGKKKGLGQDGPPFSSFRSGSVASVLSVVKKHFYPKWDMADTGFRRAAR